MLIGITGIIGSGKSTIGKWLKQQGFLVYDSDEMVKEAYQNQAIFSQIQQTFFKKEPFDKRKLKEMIYQDKNYLTMLNQFIHPYVIQQIQQLKNQAKNTMIFVEIPLLFECHLENLCDYTIVVTTNKEMQKERLKSRNPDAVDFLLYLQQQQFSQEEKSKRADFIIENSADFKTTEKSLESLVDKLKKIY